MLPRCGNCRCPMSRACGWDAAKAAGPALDGENGTAEDEGRARARKGEKIWQSNFKNND